MVGPDDGIQTHTQFALDDAVEKRLCLTIHVATLAIDINALRTTMTQSLGRQPPSMAVVQQKI